VPAASEFQTENKVDRVGPNAMTRAPWQRGGDNAFHLLQLRRVEGIGLAKIVRLYWQRPRSHRYCESVAETMPAASLSRAIYFPLKVDRLVPKTITRADANALEATRSTKYSRFDFGIKGGSPCPQGDDSGHANALETTRSTFDSSFLFHPSYFQAYAYA
jgi:hypothetical protein